MKQLIRIYEYSMNIIKKKIGYATSKIADENSIYCSLGCSKGGLKNLKKLWKWIKMNFLIYLRVVNWDLTVGEEAELEDIWFWRTNPQWPQCHYSPFPFWSWQNWKVFIVAIVLMHWVIKWNYLENRHFVFPCPGSQGESWSLASS